MSDMNKNNKLVSKSDKQDAAVTKQIHALKSAEALAEYIVKSETFAKNFKDEDGNVNKSDVIAAIVLGSELGIPPMSAITLGKKLNTDAFFKVMRGKELGLDSISAMTNISIIPNKNGDTVHTGVHVIAKVLLDNKVKFKITEDFTPVYSYISTKTKNKVDVDRWREHIFSVDADTPIQDLNKAKEEGKILCTKRLETRRTTIVFNREGFEEIEISYTLQQATDAGLYKGTTSDGEVVEGKANWNNHPATMLRNRALAIGGRIICADKLQNTYSSEEASEFTDYEIITEDDVKDIIQEQTDNIEESTQTDQETDQESESDQD